LGWQAEEAEAGAEAEVAVVVEEEAEEEVDDSLVTLTCSMLKQSRRLNLNAVGAWEVLMPDTEQH
jgi:hypothetical protein